MRFFLSFLSFFNFFCLSAQSQFSESTRRPLASGVVNLTRKSDGYWYEIGKSGPEMKIKIDSTQVTGFAQLANNISTLTAFRSLSALRGSKLKVNKAPGVVNLIDKGMAGIFVLDSRDITTPDNTGRIIVTASGLRYKRVIQGGLIELAWYGAKGDGVTDDTQAVQKAINDAVSAAPAISMLPIYGRSGTSGTLLVPVGTFRISTVKVNGSIRIVGQGGGTYAGSFFLQKSPNISMILLGPDVDKQSNSTVIENICFRSGSPTTAPDVAQIKTVSGIQSNSVYIRNCWFQTPETYAIWLTQGDDIQISGCTFDVCPFHAIRLGTVGKEHVANCTITNNTFYQVKVNHIKLENVTGIIIANNRAYNSNNVQIPTATFINGAGATKIEGLSITGNEYLSVPRFAYLETTAKVVAITGNTGYNTSGFFLYLTGGGVMYGASVTGNSAYSPVAWSEAPISGSGCGLQSSVIVGNTFFAGANTELGLNLPDGRTNNNIIDKNVFTNFKIKNNIANLADNGQTAPENIDLKSGDLLYYDGKKITRIPKGADGQFLKMKSGIPTWSN